MTSQALKDTLCISFAYAIHIIRTANALGVMSTHTAC